MQVTRHGGKFYLPQQISPRQIISVCQEASRHFSFLFLSAHTDTKLFNQVFASGANDFINKLVTAQQLAYRTLNRLVVATNQ